MIDESAYGRVASSNDLWCGRLYPEDVIRVPTTITILSHYRGLQSPYLSQNDPEFLKSLWHDPVRTHAEVMSMTSLEKPAKCGVALDWNQIGLVLPDRSVWVIAKEITRMRLLLMASMGPMCQYVHSP